MRAWPRPTRQSSQACGMSHRMIVPAAMSALVDNVSYSPAVRVGDEVHVSGQVGRDASMTAVTTSREAHIRQAFENLKLVLAEAGARLSDVYELTTYHVDLPSHMPTFVAVKREYFGDSTTLPAWTAVGVTALNHPDFTVEIAARAHIGTPS